MSPSTKRTKTKMSYKVNDIFYSLQGEGRNTGRAAVFVRFSGCNLKCDFCDTDFSDYKEMTGMEILEAMKEAINPEGGLQAIPPKDILVVLTGGEPTLQADTKLIDLIHEAGFPVVAMESNGTHESPANLDWLTVSPKTRPVVEHCNELKVLFDGKTPVRDYGVEADYYYLQPEDTGNAEDNKAVTAKCVEYIKKHPKWRLSLQVHKLINIK